jgi:hypothetical protein
MDVVNRQLEVVGVRLGLRTGHVVVAYDVAGVAALCALGLLFLLDEDRGLGRRLGQCGAPGCGRFNLAFAGRPRRHCPGHLDAARNVGVARAGAPVASQRPAAERQAAWRAPRRLDHDPVEQLTLHGRTEPACVRRTSAARTASESRLSAAQMFSNE